MNGKYIGPFRVLASLGRGSTGEVFLAERQGEFLQRVAIKVIETPLHLQEAKILAALDHPHIVKFIDRGTLPNGIEYLVMEYVEGLPIDAYCEKHALSLAERVNLLLEIMDAVAHAHRQLIIHADLKPANILVTESGEPKLLDFGLAQSDGMAFARAHTPDFASPEQKDGGRLTAASDVYSLGVLARGLFAGSGRRRLAGDLQAIIEAATQPDRNRRYASIDDFRADLQRFAQGREVSVRRTGPLGRALRWIPRHRTVSVTAGVVCIAALASIAGVMDNAARATRQRALAQAELRTLLQLTGTLAGELYESAGHLAQSSDARRVLLKGATAALADVASRGEQDSLLNLDLAIQYAHVARLQLAQAAEDGGDARRIARENIDSALAILTRIGMSDAQYSRARGEITMLRELRGEAGD